MPRTRDIYVPPEGPPQGEPLSPDLYAKMGEANIYRMLEDFYRELATSTIRHMFPADSPELMKTASRRSAAFFIAVMGGPPLYHQLYGPPMMRKRHMPFEIDEDARKEWLNAFERVLENAPDQYDFPEEHLPAFRAFLSGFSAWMVNALPA